MQEVNARRSHCFPLTLRVHIGTLLASDLPVLQGFSLLRRSHARSARRRVVRFDDRAASGFILMGRIVLLEGDITDIEADAVVNAANSALILGAGVAGAIAEKGGPSIQAECDAIGPIEVGEAVVTGAGNLSARHLIHAAGMPPGGAATEESIRACVRRSLELAREKSCRTIAIPAIGAGIGGLSEQRCAEILLEEARAHLAGETSLEEVRFVLLGEPTYRIFEMAKDAEAVQAQLARLRAR
jgi:O-acetyl-ADP-ribose deacetylase (regulator of RNase III)